MRSLPINQGSCDALRRAQEDANDLVVLLDKVESPNATESPPHQPLGLGIILAFSTCIGGVLFTLKEGCLYWSAKLVCHVFFYTMVTIGTIMTMAGLNHPGSRTFGKLFSFGEFTSLRGGRISYVMWELALFLMIGCIGDVVDGQLFPCAPLILVVDFSILF